MEKKKKNFSEKLEAKFIFPS